MIHDPDPRTPADDDQPADGRGLSSQDPAEGSDDTPPADDGSPQG
ncbi:hypothetical protein GGQ80_001034 [Sphingomonas jinjuensis]|uniref:Uncharacterized protein n=1 Tax=Sphingomonas jinjuensis TaxID=535907 RepID=A0A840FA31_9SPHN|nr:hypothetical protein [Sphingomonas jinjuensis]MBB4153146.1 hypothetical protein [Sphingomonas jinjuensis]